MSNSHKIKGIRPEDNTVADIFPLKYFSYALEKVQASEKELEIIEYDDGCQTLLVNLDMLLTICRKYPNTASMAIYRLKRKHLKSVFDAWWERNEKKIPAKYRIGIRDSANSLFSELFAIQSWAKSE